MAVLFNGWGFGVEDNEPRGHYYIVSDQLEIDPSRLKSGGVCLTCKSPYASRLQKETGPDYFKQPYLDVHAKIPKEAQKLGASCNDCHNNKDMTNRLERWTLKQALKDIGKDPDQLARQEMRSLVCASILPMATSLSASGSTPCHAGSSVRPSSTGAAASRRIVPARRSLPGSMFAASRASKSQRKGERALSAFVAVSFSQ